MDLMTMTEFTPLSAAVGGILIGLSAVLMMATTGRIAGVSGFVSRLLPPYADDQTLSRLTFVAGLIAAPWLHSAIGRGAVDTTVTRNVVLLVSGGLLVGFGAVWGSGCTSGHGVCGVARLSKRSIAATAVFMTSGLATVFVSRHLLGG
jgi:uncharacterized membrane protein YedE/YeeE